MSGSMIDAIPTLDNIGLANLRENAERLGAGTPSPRQAEAALLLPLIDEEVARRAQTQKVARAVKSSAAKAAKPKVTKVSKVSKKKAVAEEVEADEMADDE
jgi:isocitrate/isopropylmalate dehydrogenase